MTEDRVSVRAAFADVFRRPRRLVAASVVLGLGALVPWVGAVPLLGYNATYARRVAQDDEPELEGVSAVREILIAGAVLWAWILAAGIVIAPLAIALLGWVVRRLLHGLGEDVLFEATFLVLPVVAVLTECAMAGMYAGTGAVSRLAVTEAFRRAVRHPAAFLPAVLVLALRSMLVLTVSWLLGTALGTRVSGACAKAMQLAWSGHLTLPLAEAAAGYIAIYTALLPLGFVAAHLLGQYARTAFPGDEPQADVPEPPVPEPQTSADDSFESWRA